MQASRDHPPGPGPSSGSDSAKPPRQRQLQLGRGLLVNDVDSNNKKRQRFQPCPVCNRTFALFRLEDHVNQCLDSTPRPPPPRLSSSSSSSSASAVAGHRNPSPLLLPSPAAGAVDLRAASATLLRTPLSSRPCEPRLEHHGPASELTRDAPCLASAAKAEPCCLSPLRPTQGGEEILTASAAAAFKPHQVEGTAAGCQGILEHAVGTRRHQDVSHHHWTESCGSRENDGRGMEQHPYQTPFAGAGGAKGSAKEGEGNGEDESERVIQIHFNTGWIEEGREQDRGPTGNGTTKDLIDGRAVNRPPAGFKLFQRQVQSQARLSMFNKFSPSANLQRKPSVTVLQPGMVLFRSCLDLETQQKFVMESQDAEHLFHRATTSGGGKYHVYSVW